MFKTLIYMAKVEEKTIDKRGSSVFTGSKKEFLHSTINLNTHTIYLCIHPSVSKVRVVSFRIQPLIKSWIVLGMSRELDCLYLLGVFTVENGSTYWMLCVCVCVCGHKLILKECVENNRKLDGFNFRLPK